MNWKNLVNWKKASRNTLWCLLGCSIGDFGVILYFQTFHPMYSGIFSIMILAIAAGLFTSIVLETIILKMKDNFSWDESVGFAIKMSFISMISMEITMNLVDFFLTGGAILTLWAIPIMLIVGFLTPLPYNYWRLEKHGKSCH